jgi:esterase/lipase superfamily enzyme
MTTTILLLAANPTETARLRLAAEVRDIEQGLQRANQRDQFKLFSKGAVRPRDLQRAMLDHVPNIVHFSGHGHGETGIVLEDNQGNAHLVTTAALASLFKLFNKNDKITCVLLNACYSDVQAQTIAQHVPYVIGMSNAIDDKAAIEFSVAFYDAIGAGKSIEFAYESGCLSIQLAGIDDHLTPVLIKQSEDLGVNNTRGGKITDDKTATTSTTSATSRGGDVRDRKAEDLPHLYPVWFGTNREPLDKNDLTQGFSGDRASELNAVYYGKCDVAIPKTHRFGETGRAWLKRWMSFDFNGDDNLQLQAIHNSKDADDFWQQLNTQFQDNNPLERDAVCFLHGFNTSFEEAAIRAAQIGFDLKVRGHTAFFSWPSKGKMLKYSTDESSIMASEQAITNFLLDSTQKSGAERVHLIAHSMGNRGLLAALKNISHKVKQTNSKIKFGQIILAAADLDVDVFRQAKHAYTDLSESTTVYASSTDLPVRLSELLHGYPRLGFARPVTVEEGIDTIEVNNFELLNLGHGYFAEAGALLHDMFDLIQHSESPKNRQNLREQSTQDGKRYWLLDTK